MDLEQNVSVYLDAEQVEYNLDHVLHGFTPIQDLVHCLQEEFDGALVTVVV